MPAQDRGRELDHGVDGAGQHHGHHGPRPGDGAVDLAGDLVGPAHGVGQGQGRAAQSATTLLPPLPARAAAARRRSASASISARAGVDVGAERGHRLEDLGGDVVLVELEAEAHLDRGDQLDQGERVELGQAAEELGPRRVARRGRRRGRRRAPRRGPRSWSVVVGVVVVLVVGVVIACLSGRSGSRSRGCSHQHLQRRGMAEEGRGARGVAVGAGLEEHDEVAHLARAAARPCRRAGPAGCTGSRPPGRSRPARRPSGSPTAIG